MLLAPARADDIMRHFPKEFTRLGTLGEEYTIRLRENVTPFALYAHETCQYPYVPK